MHELRLAAGPSLGRIPNIPTLPTDYSAPRPGGLNVPRRAGHACCVGDRRVGAKGGNATLRRKTPQAAWGCARPVGPPRARKRLALVTDVGALPNDWGTDPTLLERVLTRLRQWGRGEEIPHVSETMNSVDRQQPDHPVFGVSCRRASPADPPVDITMPRSPDRSPVACPPPLFRRPVGPTTPINESGS